MGSRRKPIHHQSGHRAVEVSVVVVVVDAPVHALVHVPDVPAHVLVVADKRPVGINLKGKSAIDPIDDNYGQRSIPFL